VIRLPSGRVDNVELGQRHFGDRLITNDSYDFEQASATVAGGEVSAVSFGRYYISNPDLVERWQKGAALAELDPISMYTPGEEGYTSYPSA
jgi:N-ethylmaleimide reductase